MRPLVSGSSWNQTPRNAPCVRARAPSLALSATASAPQHDPASTLFGVLWRSNRVHQIAARGGISKKFRNIPVTGVGDAVSRALGLSAAGADAYFAPAEFQTPANRTAANASGAYAFWMDVDCGESKAAAGSGYRTTADARSALAQVLPRHRTARADAHRRQRWRPPRLLDPERICSARAVAIVRAQIQAPCGGLPCLGPMDAGRRTSPASCAYRGR